MVEESIRKETQVRSSIYEKEGNANDVNTEDENDELEYEAWKLRELKRNKRDREEREAYVYHIFQCFNLVHKLYPIVYYYTSCIKIEQFSNYLIKYI